MVGGGKDRETFGGHWGHRNDSYNYESQRNLLLLLLVLDTTHILIEKS